jgi:hypothetical protein
MLQEQMALNIKDPEADHLARRTGRTPEELIGYDERGLPR